MQKGSYAKICGNIRLDAHERERLATPRAIATYNKCLAQELEWMRWFATFLASSGSRDT